MTGLRLALALASAALVAPAAMAQTAEAPAAAPASEPTPAAAPAPAPEPAPAMADASAPACELHVWPAASVSATTQGVGAGFGLVGALIDAAAHAEQNKRDTAFITGALDANAQAQALRQLDLPTRLHLPPSQVIVHEQGIELKKDDPRRLSDSTAQCYSEFIVRGLFYFQSVAYKAQMRTFLEVRRFDGQTLKYDFRDSRHEKLQVKLPKEGEDTGPATDALITAFKGGVVYFSDKLARKHK